MDPAFSQVMQNIWEQSCVSHKLTRTEPFDDCLRPTWYARIWQTCYVSKHLQSARQLCSSFTTQSYSACSSCWAVLQHFGGQKWLSLIWCHNTSAVTQAPLASENLMSLQDLHQTHLHTGTSSQNFLTSMFCDAKLVDLCCIANCHYRDSLCLDKNGEDISLFFEIFVHMWITN